MLVLMDDVCRWLSFPVRMSCRLGWSVGCSKSGDGWKRTKNQVQNWPSAFFFFLLFSRDCNLKISKLTFSGGNGDSQKTKSLFIFHVSSETHYCGRGAPSPVTWHPQQHSPKYVALLPSCHHHQLIHDQPPMCLSPWWR